MSSINYEKIYKEFGDSIDSNEVHPHVEKLTQLLNINTWGIYLPNNSKDEQASSSIRAAIVQLNNALSTIAQKTNIEDNQKRKEKIEKLREFHQSIREHLKTVHKLLSRKLYDLQDNPKINASNIKQVAEKRRNLEGVIKDIYHFDAWSAQALKRFKNNEKAEKMAELVFNSNKIKYLKYLFTPGFVEEANGKILTVLADSTGETAHTLDASKPDRMVMDKEGNLFIFPHDQDPMDKLRFNLDENDDFLITGKVIVNDGIVTKFIPIEDEKVSAEALAEFNYRLKQREVISMDACIPDSELSHRYNAKKAQLNMENKREIIRGNPKALIDALRDTNKYLIERSKETSWLLSKFGAYTGKDYLDRQQFFKKLLKKLEDKKDYNEIVGFIRANLKEFTEGFRSEFADNLVKIAEALKAQPFVHHSTLAQEVIKGTSGIHKRMDFHRDVRGDRESRHQNKADYAFFQQDIKNKMQDLREDFADDHEMDEVIERNFKLF